MSQSRADRRSFLYGILATGSLSLPLGALAEALTDRPPKSTKDFVLTVATGTDQVEVMKLLIDLWQARSGVSARVVAAGKRSKEQLKYMEEHTNPGIAEEKIVDILCLDITHVSKFANSKLIRQVDRSRLIDFLENPQKTCQASPPGNGVVYYALPFTTNVGMLFKRADASGSASNITGLADLLKSETPQWVTQLPPQVGDKSEALVCNFLEHALAIDGNLLDPDGYPHSDPQAWSDALGYLRTAVLDRRAIRAPDENASASLFNAGKIDFMRNWPLWYKRAEDPKSITVAKLTTLGTGMLGGQNLSISQVSRHPDEALSLIQFLTTTVAQKILALYGYIPTLKSLYEEDDFLKALPHLDTVQDAIDAGRSRPSIPKYLDFSDAVSDTAVKFLATDGGVITKKDIQLWQSAFH